jgi:hypothetical protein
MAIAKKNLGNTSLFSPHVNILAEFFRHLHTDAEMKKKGALFRLT